MSLQQFNTENFNRTVIEESKDVLVEFSAPWCVYCRRIEPAIKVLAETYTDLIIAQVNIDDEPELAEKYKIELYLHLYISKMAKLRAI